MWRNLRNRIMGRVARAQSICMGLRRSKFSRDMPFTEACAEFNSRNELYAYMHHYFTQNLPDEVKLHRRYFKRESRGFGEDAFHAMWYLMLREFHPVHCLEIGIYRGQVISLWALLSRIFNFHCDVYGISPFSNAGDSVSIYPTELDYYFDTIRNHDAFGLTSPRLIKAFSTDEASVKLIGSKRWDLIYIDGSHDYEIVESDYIHSLASLRKGGLLVLDDSSLFTDFTPPIFSFAGHPGPSRLVRDRVMKELQFVGAVGHNSVFMKPK
jgi:hypothetical protein